MRFTVVSVDDWAGLYVDGDLVCENHTVPLHDLIRHGLPDVEERALDGTGFEEAVVEGGGLPKRLSEVPADRDHAGLR